MNRSITPVIVISCVIILVCCLCLAILISTGIISSSYLWNPFETVRMSLATHEPTPVVIRPDRQKIVETYDTLAVLKNTEIPISDLRDLAQRYKGFADIPLALDPVSTPLTVGARDSFWVSNADTEENFEIEATLAYVTDHAYFWIEDGLGYRESDLKKLAETFENQIYPETRKVFGNEWTPGVDGDPHLYIIYASGLGERLAGCFSSADEYHPLAHEYSNMHEIFMLNADNLDLGDGYTYGVLAHELQHMIHWYQDRNEDAWISEGLSELASYLNGYDAGGFDRIYAEDPDLQLNDWPDESEDAAPHYGASFLFMVYLLDRFGFPAIHALVQHKENDLASIDAMLEDLQAVDASTGEKVGADDVFLDWVISSMVNDATMLDGRYTYTSYVEAPRTSVTESIPSCPAGLETRDVHQYGADYIELACRGNYVLRFEGSVEVPILPAEAHSGVYAFWSNRGDDSDMTLTKTFDFEQYYGPLTLTYWTWYDVEADYDYVYLSASSDGQSWQILTTPSGTAMNPSGNNLGWGYNWVSGGDGTWIQERVDISQYAGKQVQIRFEYITDGAVNGDGFLIDDVAIPEAGYFTDFESDAGGWSGAGFVRIQNNLPQTFRLALIERGASPQVKYIALDADNAVDIPININGDVSDAVLVVTGTTRFTRQKAGYQFQIMP